MSHQDSVNTNLSIGKIEDRHNNAVCPTARSPQTNMNCYSFTSHTSTFQNI